MKESILHYIWQNKLFETVNLFTQTNERIEIIDTGKPNTDAGPDFFNAKIRIADTVWAGNVEIHSISSEWFKHQHHQNKAYDNVILHVVKEIDEDVFNSTGKLIPQIKLIFSDKIEENYHQLINNNKWLPCSDRIEEIPHIFIKDWINYLLTERLEQKTSIIQNYLRLSDNHWEEAFYLNLAKSFGFGINGQAFEMLARNLPSGILAKHKNNLFQLESLLFGQAGLLYNQADEYANELLNEYLFLKKKYELHELDASIWKLLRLHPGNFPHVRIAQFAALIHHSSKLLSRILENPDVKLLKDFFSYEPSVYWKNHFHFGNSSIDKQKKIGNQSIESLLINAVVPFIFCYATQKNDQQLKEKSILILENLSSEKNSIIDKWRQNGMCIENAYESQAFLQLKKLYCDEKKCLRCRIGHKVLTI